MFSKHVLAAALTAQPVASVAAAIDFDGTNDYLSRSSDLTGNADGKTFTFSAWAWVNNDAVSSAIYSGCVSSVGSERFSVVYSGNGGWTFTARNSANTTVYNKSLSNVWPRQGWNHLLLSVDLTNSANHFVFINDIQQAGGFTTYTNDLIDFTNTYHSIGAGTSAINKCNGRIAGVYLDYTYRDLSVTANRRLFITADRKPAANQAALNPILYLPLNDPTQAGKNLGTGGDFALTGVVARAGRGPNQFNAAYSDLDGSGDYLKRSSNISGIANGKTFTFGCVVCLDAIGAANSYFFNIWDSGNVKFYVTIMTNGVIEVWGADVAGSQVLLEARTSNAIAVGRNYHILVSADLSDTNKRQFYINGEGVSVSWNRYINGDINFSTATPAVAVGSNYIGSGNFVNGRIGNLFFDTRYIDLSQPANLTKFVTGTGIDAKPVDMGANGELPFGTPPLIYLPMYGNNAGKNYGTGGDFTVNSGPFTGARGPNEFWGNKAVFNGSTGYLERSPQLTGVVNSNKLSLVCTINKRVTTTGHYLIGSNNGSILVFVNGSNQLVILAKNNSSITILTATVTSPLISDNTIFSIMIFCDLSDTIKRGIYINGTPAATVNWSTYTNDTIALSQSTVLQVGANGAGAAKLDGSLSEFYFTTEYIDFSQEANRLKFRDAFGNPVDLSPQIQVGTLPNPAIYMRFDPANFGKNSGTGGDFTVNGTITDGGQL